MNPKSGWDIDNQEQSRRRDRQWDGINHSDWIVAERGRGQRGGLVI
jgi:hypothetical protein